MKNNPRQRILLGITGSIAAYKTPDLVRKLIEANYEVRVVLTNSGKAFVSPLSLQVTSRHKVYEKLIDCDAEAAMSHIELARWPTCLLIAPASANLLAKLAHGMAEDLLSTLCLTTQAPIILAPAMNQAMWHNSATQNNVNLLIKRNFQFIGPIQGIQACGEIGFGRMAEVDQILAELATHLTPRFLQGKRLLITAGPTQEPLDPVRFLSNRSSGKMGYALARMAVALGAEVTLISGPVTLPPVNCQMVYVKTASEMLKAVETHIQDQNIFIGAAAVADYYIDNIALQKIKKQSQALRITLQPTQDILLKIANKKSQKLFLVGFSAETTNMLDFAENKRIKKGCDLMIVNDVSQSGIGFDSEENEVTVLSAFTSAIHLKQAPKMKIAQQLLSIIHQQYIQKSLSFVN